LIAAEKPEDLLASSSALHLQKGAAEWTLRTCREWKPAHGEGAAKGALALALRTNPGVMFK
jgi:hypothetical protein